MRYILLVLTILAVVSFSGCGYKEGVATGAQKSYLYFTGNVDGAAVSIDDSEEFEVKAGRDNQYGIKPGKHIITIYKDDMLILKREIFVGDGIAKEIEVK
jgi:hypothetical protein